MGRRLTLVSAPPGFGKTTLILQWLAQIERPTAWLTLDEGDNDPVTFVRYLTATLRQSPAQDSGNAEAALVALINILADEGAEQALVLDDYQAITNFAVHNLVTFLLSHQPPCLHVVVGTREDPPLPLARLRGHDQLSEVRERHLRFTAEETDAFLNDALALCVPTAIVEALAARTEGWITALQLAGVALQSAPSAEEFARSFAGNNRFIADYLMEEVLGRQSERVRQFLRQTAVLDRLNAPLCDAVAGGNAAQALLEQLEAANLFLQPLDHHRGWWRYHALFAEMLRLTLTAQEMRELHLKATAWCNANQVPDLAVYHARRAAKLAPALPAQRHASRDEPLVEPLSDRELEVLRLIAQGLSNQAIGKQLYIAEGTVKRHVNNIYGKLQVASRTQALAVGRELRLLD